MHTTGEKIGQVERTVRSTCEDHPDIAETVEHVIRVHYGLLEEDAENATTILRQRTQVSEE